MASRPEGVFLSVRRRVIDDGCCSQTCLPIELFSSILFFFPFPLSRVLETPKWQRWGVLAVEQALQGLADVMQRSHSTQNLSLFLFFLFFFLFSLSFFFNGPFFYAFFFLSRLVDRTGFHVRKIKSPCTISSSSSSLLHLRLGRARAHACPSLYPSIHPSLRLTSNSPKLHMRVRIYRQYVCV